MSLWPNCLVFLVYRLVNTKFLHSIAHAKDKKNCKKAITKANKIMGNLGRILVRKSGTESKIRIMAESYKKNLIIQCIKIIKRSIK